ncbi:MAG: class I SAM-dependent methyltransferase [Gammaproteobacteria bacterium]
MIAEQENANAIGHLERLRRFELDCVRGCFPHGARVLELGGGSGFQASIIAGWGCEVSAFDVPERPLPPREYFPVQEYDGRHVPFASETFDVVFSSNVLEHIRDLPASLAQLRRVLKHDGRGVHILPTPVWRGWTSVTHYARILPLALRRLRGPGAVAAAVASNAAAAAPRRSLGELLRCNLLPGPHGEYPSAFSEFWYFSRKRWLEVFAASGFEVERDYPTGLFYTGYSLLPSLPVESRVTLAKVLGSSCRVFVMRKSTTVESRGS